jgi:hypothetical protein
VLHARCPHSDSARPRVSVSTASVALVGPLTPARAFILMCDIFDMSNIVAHIHDAIDDAGHRRGDRHRRRVLLLYQVDDVHLPVAHGRCGSTASLMITRRRIFSRSVTHFSNPRHADAYAALVLPLRCVSRSMNAKCSRVALLHCLVPRRHSACVYSW